MDKKKILLCQRGRYFNKNKTYNSFQQILSEYHIDNYEDLDVFNDRDFFNYDTTIFFTQFGEFTEEQEKNVLDFISSGKGFVGLHGASASFKEHPNYYEMLGGRFIGHKKVTNYDIKIIDPNHPITQDLEDFSFIDEPYRHDFSMGKDIHVLAKGDYHDEEDPKPEPIMWTKSFGKGRIFFCALGHRASSLKHETFQTIISRAVKWVLEGQ